MRKMNIKLGDIRNCFVALGKEYLNYSIYGDGSLSKYDKLELIERLSGKYFDEETEWCYVDLDDLGIPDSKYIEIGIKCFTSGILLTEYDYETIAGQIACALYHLKNIDLSGRATKVFISLKVDTSQEFAPDYENNCWLSTFASPLEYLF